MDQDTKKSNWKIWLYLSPLYIAVVIAIPLVKWTTKSNPGDEHKAFHFQEGELKKNDSPLPPQELAGGGLPAHYESGQNAAERPNGYAPETEAEERQTAQKPKTAAKPGSRKNEADVGRQVPGPKNPKEERKQMSIGFTKDYITYLAGKNMNNPKAISALLNNSFVVKGFMARGTVKSALGSMQGLQNYLSNSAAVNGFLGKSVIKAGLANPKILDAVLSSSLTTAVMNSPAMQDLAKHPDLMGAMVASNPQIIMLMTNPTIMNALLNNPQTAGLAGSVSMGGMGNTGR